MSQFEKFKEKLEITFKEDSEKNWNNIVGEFIEQFGIDKNPLNAELKYDNTVDNSDSYDYTDETYEKVFYFPEFDIFVQFTGWQRSYDGGGWNTDFKEVKLKTIETVVYE